MSTVRKVAALLDLDPDDMTPGAPLPRGWHFVLMAADTRRSGLRGDGFPGLGVPMPDLGLPRLMLGGRSVSFRDDIPIGSKVMRESSVRSVVRKNGTSGPMAVVTLAHELRVDGQKDPAVIETQTYLLLPSNNAAAEPHEAPPEPPAPPVQAAHLKTAMPDEILLFQYSALGFNSHRIHIDREHARQVEGFPDLVVNGGLSTLLLTEWLRRDLGVTPATLKVRHLAPLFCNRALSMAADRVGDGWHLRALGDQHRLAVDMEVTV